MLYGKHRPHWREVENSHGGNVMLAELAGVVELRLIEEVADGGLVVYTTAGNGP